jgi:predicted DNA-binding protein (MmcQ/YjbR family)
MPPEPSLSAAARAFAFGLPGAWEDHPWGDTVAKVGKKVFVFLGADDAAAPFHFTVKLRDAHDDASAMPWVVPAGYGLDRGGWVSCSAPGDTPLDLVTGWIEESYRIVAPKRLVAELDARDAGR